MEKIGYIEIKITGSRGNLDLTRDTYDIREIRDMLEQVEGLLVPNDKKDRPIISYQLESGSVRHIFKTSIQYIIGFNAILGQISVGKSIDFLDLPTAKAFESFQEAAIKKHYSFEINTSIEQSNKVHIDSTTKFSRAISIWGNAEFYFYGRVISMGGKDKSNIHLATADQGIIIIQTNREYLEKLEQNLLYKYFGIRVSGKQHIETGEVDKSTLKFLELVDYQPKYDEAYLRELRSKARNNWSTGFNAEDWLKEVRGGYDA